MGTGVQKEGVSGGQTRETREKEEKRITLERKKKKKTHQLRNNVSNFPPTQKMPPQQPGKLKALFHLCLFFGGGRAGSLIDLLKVRK